MKEREKRSRQPGRSQQGQTHPRHTHTHTHTVKTNRTNININHKRCLQINLQTINIYIHIVATRPRHGPFSGASRTAYTVAGQQPATTSPYWPWGISLTGRTCVPGDPGIKGATPTPEGRESNGRGGHEDDRERWILDANRTAAACRVTIIVFSVIAFALCLCC